MTLHIVNGDVFADALRKTQLSGDILPWRDILHEGPVPSDASPDHFYEVRAQFIAGRGWASYGDVRAMFAEREHILSQASSHSEIVLWFDPDLYDQLQLLQVLNRLSGMALPATRVSMTHSRHPGANDAETIQMLFEHRTPVTTAQYEIAGRGWQAITAVHPGAVEELAHSGELSVFPWLGAALQRYVEEFPCERDGLSRTERSVLRATAETASLQEAFAAVQHSEQQPFLGDTTFASYIQQFATAQYPLLQPAPETEPVPPNAMGRQFWKQKFQLTKHGASVLQQQINNVVLNGINRHVGGVHLHGDTPLWYRNSNGQLVKNNSR